MVREGQGAQQAIASLLLRHREPRFWIGISLMVKPARKLKKAAECLGEVAIMQDIYLASSLFAMVTAQIPKELGLGTVCPYDYASVNMSAS